MRIFQNIIGLLCLLLCACSEPVRPALPELPISSKALFFHNFLLQPPKEPGWLIVNHQNHRLEIAKKGKVQDESYTLQFWLLKLPSNITRQTQFLNHIQDGLALKSTQTRFKTFKDDWKQLELATLSCISFDKRILDSNPKRGSTRKDAMMLEIAGITCRHPKKSNHAVQIAYSHRHYAENSDPQFSEQAKLLLNRLSFDAESNDLP